MLTTIISSLFPTVSSTLQHLGEATEENRALIKETTRRKELEDIYGNGSIAHTVSLLWDTEKLEQLTMTIHQRSTLKGHMADRLYSIDMSFNDDTSIPAISLPVIHDCLSQSQHLRRRLMLPRLLFVLGYIHKSCSCNNNWLVDYMWKAQWRYNCLKALKKIDCVEPALSLPLLLGVYEEVYDTCAPLHVEAKG